MGVAFPGAGPLPLPGHPEKNFGPPLPILVTDTHDEHILEPTPLACHAKTPGGYIFFKTKALLP